MTFRSLIAVVAAGVLLAGHPAARAADDGAALEMRASQALAKGDYAAALPMLRTLAEKVKDQPDRLGRLAEQIRVCEKNLATTPPTPPVAPEASPAAPADAGAGGAAGTRTAEARKPIAKPKDGQALELAIKDLGNFEYDAEKGGQIPADVRELNGVKLRTHGFMQPLDQAANITSFALVPSLFSCCFGQPPQIQHTIVVTCPKGKSVSYFPDEIVVEGTLVVKERKEDGYIVSVFEMEVASVKPAAK